MHSLIHLFFLLSLLVLFLSPKYICSLLSLSSETNLFKLHSLPHGYLTFLGDSHLRYNEIIMTNEDMRIDAPRSTGVVFYSHPILLPDSHTKKVPSFYTYFAFSMENRHGDEEAFGDGLAFLISPRDDLLGSAGFLGLTDSTEVTRNKFIAIEFDTKCDSKFHDPDDNHVGLDINSLFSVKLAASSSLGVNLKSGSLIYTWINHKSDEKRLEVFVSRSYLKPKNPVLKVDIDLSDYLQEKNMFVGFSAATEGSLQVTRIAQWEFTVVEFNTPPPPPPLSSHEPENTFPNPPQSGNKHRHHSTFAIGLTAGVCFVFFTGLFGWFCRKKLIRMIKKSEGANKLDMQPVGSSGGIHYQEILLSILVGEVARRLDIEKVLNNEAELISVKTVKSSIPSCNSLPAVKPSIVPLCNCLPRSANNITSV